MDGLVAQFGLGPGLESLILAVGLVVARVTPIVYMVPVFGGHSAPPIMRIGLAILIGVLLAPSLTPVLPPNILLYAGLVLKEALVGAAIGYLTLLTFFALEMAGRLVDTMRGANLAEAIVPGIEERSSPLGNLQFQIGVVVFLLIGGHRVLLATLAESFEWIPIDRVPDMTHSGLGAFTLGVGGAVGHAVATALLLSAPAMIALFATEVSLGILGRVAPTISVHFVGMPLRAAMGLAVVLFALTLILPELHPMFANALATVASALRSLR